MKKIFGHAVMVAEKYKIIPNEKSLVQSKIKPQYLSKRRLWSFSTIFVLIGNPQ